MQIHEIQRNTKTQTTKRVGRGGRRGKTSGRGHKGQKSRAGRAPRPAMRDIIKKIPKLRGHGKNRARTVNNSSVKPQVVTLARLAAEAKKGSIISPQSLVTMGLVEKKGGKHPAVKILGNGEISVALKVVGCSVSKSAQEKIEKAGGTVKQ